MYRNLTVQDGKYLMDEARRGARRSNASMAESSLCITLSLTTTTTTMSTQLLANFPELAHLTYVSYPPLCRV